MTLKAGDSIPAATLATMTEAGPKPLTTDEIFKGKKVVLFAVPGAFTPLCSGQHLPGYVKLAKEIKAKGVDTIACVSVNDVFVMGAWGKSQGADEILLLADGNAAFTKAMGLELDGTPMNLGIRSQRYAMIVDDGVIKTLQVEEGRNFAVSNAESMLALL
ncbi:MAG: peroxiredoxin [Pseudomonadales bacterium]|jgi:peroxiredoxin|nr:peroxiredoxin [Pseudomonadales bacterium]MCC6530758.1 peroxiredoxin [Pseudomonadales bacterium]MCP5333845.1 peroxiredoxin [Pseudomonadales bacterium]HMU90902.1 peroxiredoxin [Pseudomonadales bacterium]HMW15770.1 peroxiredoxin [Pseudomonadales bacterium]